MWAKRQIIFTFVLHFRSLLKPLNSIEGVRVAATSILPPGKSPVPPLILLFIEETKTSHIPQRKRR